MTDTPGFSSAGSVPVPDPTKLTTDAVNAATSQWRRDLASVREIIETRFDAMDKAVVLRLAQIDAAPAMMREEITHLRELVRERFDSVERQFTAERELGDQKFTAVNTRFEERDDRSRQAAIESRVSLDAALAAAKEAVSEQNKANTLAIGKSELATQKQIDALSLLMTTSATGLDEKIADIKGRLDRNEGRSSGFSAGWAILVGAFGLLAAAASIIAILKP